jgi:thiol-disulfide isomerase/thioredoxin
MSILNFPTTTIARTIFIGCLSIVGISNAAEKAFYNSPVHEIVTASELEKLEGPVFIIFYLPSCPACKSYAPHFERAARASTSAHFVRVNGNDNRTADLRRKFGINTFPTVILLRKDGSTQRFKDRPASGKLIKIAQAESGRSTK